MLPGGVSVKQRGIVETAPVGPHAVALHHELCGAFGGDRQPDRGRCEMHRDRDFLDGGAELAEQVSARLDLSIDVRLRAWMAKAFLDHSDAQSPDAAAELVGILRNPE